jgi:hypothetical protein
MNGEPSAAGMLLSRDIWARRGDRISVDVGRAERADGNKNEAEAETLRPRSLRERHGGRDHARAHRRKVTRISGPYRPSEYSLGRYDGSNSGSSTCSSTMTVTARWPSTCCKR